MKPTLFDRFFKLLYKLRYFTLSFWLICLIVGIIIGTRIFNTTANGIEAPDGAQAYEAAKITAKYFPDHSGEKSVYGFFHNIGRENLTEIKCVEKVNVNFQEDIKRWEKKNNRKLIGYKLISYFLTDNQQLKDNLLAENKNGSMLMIELATDGQQRYDDFHTIEKMLTERVKGDCTDEEREDLVFGMMGQLALELDSRKRVVEEMGKMEYFCIPIALVILVIMFRSFRMLLVPILTTGTGTMTSFLIMYPLAKYCFMLVTFAPTLMLSMCLAMSIDYALFFITRFREELSKGKSVARATHEMQRYSGRIILLSGVILTIAFCGDMFLRNEMLFTLGLGLAVAIMTNMLVNYTMIPSLILAFPSFFSDFNYLGAGHCMSLVLCCRHKAWKFIGIKPFKPRRVIVMDEAESLNSNERTAGAYLENGSEAKPLVSGARAVPGGFQVDRMQGANSSMEKGRGYSLDCEYDNGFETATTDEVIHELQKEQKKSCWFRLTQWTTKLIPSIIICVVIIGLCVPFAIFFLMKFQNSIAIEQILSHGSDTMNTYHYIKGDFAPGISQPLELMLDASSIGGYIGVNTYKYFQKLLESAAEKFPDIISIPSILSPFYNANQQMMPEMIDTEARGICESQGGDAFCEAFAMVVHRYVSPVDGNSSCIIAIGTASDPMGEVVYNWLPEFYEWLRNYLRDNEPPMPEPVEPGPIPLDEVSLDGNLLTTGKCEKSSVESGSIEPVDGPAKKRSWSNIFAKKTKEAKVFEEFPFKSNNGVIMGLDGSPVQLADTVRSIYKVLPYCVSISFGIVFILVGVIFKSVMVPIRTVFSLAVTLLTVYGLVTMLFQKHALAWMIPFLKEVDALYFFVPVFGFTLVLGLALDYDVFLFFRIVEYRDAGFSTRASVIKGMASSGSIINAAGIIMAVAFSGLIISHMSVLVELGVMLVLTVLYDTFVVRVFFVPALISLLGRANWWPGRRPIETKDEDDVSDQIARSNEVDDEEEWLKFMEINQTNQPTLASQAISADEEKCKEASTYFQPIRKRKHEDEHSFTAMDGRSSQAQPPESLSTIEATLPAKL
ncbi:putative MmpL efflux pump [Monocercomonoides exilis]|uniref:putative MmpL efflux pump n=1 Tax=Monocercomonoides exilis TaxID=2049356 RepID=UPI003559E30C|nr:putative MmpL efflux pump [Monocercomonoides exilis]